VNGRREGYARLPIIIVQGAVRRLEWLVEIEGIAIGADDEPDLPSF
jgi:hypothetical protein